MFLRSRMNARAYSRVLSPSTSGSGLPYPIPPCTSLYPVPARPTWLFNLCTVSGIQILGPWQSQQVAGQRTVLNLINLTLNLKKKNRNVSMTQTPPPRGHPHRHPGILQKSEVEIRAILLKKIGGFHPKSNLTYIL